VGNPIRFLQRASESWMLRPDLTILLRVPAELARKRIEGRPNLVRFEDLAFLRRNARANTLAVSRSPR
jgi:thymidylate kinase